VTLLLAAGEARLPELAVRRALAASPRRLSRLLLIETAVLTLFGAAIGLGLAWAKRARRQIVRGLPGDRQSCQRPEGPATLVWLGLTPHTQTNWAPFA
jgi:hypothetical protein